MPLPVCQFPCEPSQPPQIERAFRRFKRIAPSTDQNIERDVASPIDWAVERFARLTHKISGRIGVGPMKDLWFKQHIGRQILRSVSKLLRVGFEYNSPPACVIVRMRLVLDVSDTRQETPRPSP